MKAVKINNVRRWRRRNRVRKKLQGCSETPRLSVYRSNKNIFCQLIDDESGKTLASASTREKGLSDQINYGVNCGAAKLIGTTIAERAKAAGIEKCRFDRGQYKYHGRVAVLADAAREGGLQF